MRELELSVLLKGNLLPAQIQSTVAFMLNADRFSVLGNGGTWFETGFVCLCVLFGNIQCFCSRPVLMSGYFQPCSLRSLWLGSTAQFSFPALPVCMYIYPHARRRSLCRHRSFIPDTNRQTPPPPQTVVRRRSLRDVHAQRLQTYLLDKISRIPPHENSAAGEKQGVCLSCFFSLSFSVCLCDRGTKERGKLLLFKTSRGELKLQNHSQSINRQTSGGTLSQFLPFT